MRKVRITVLCLFFLFQFATGECRASEPYDNIAMPQGWYFSAYPYYYGASRLNDKNGNAVAAKPDAKIYQNTFKVNYYDRTVLPNTLMFSTLLPVGCIEMFGDRDCGNGDLTLAAAYWLIDDPVSKTWLGARLQTIAPVGSFDKNKKANMGSNVWKFRPMLYFAKQSGNIHLELTGKYSSYTRNNDTDTRQGDDVCVESYAGYFLRPSMLLGGHFNATFGQHKTVGGAPVNGSGVRGYQAGPSLFNNFGNGFSATLEALSDFGVKNGTQGYTVVMRLSWKL